MNNFSRRELGFGLSALMLANTLPANATAKARIIIIGGGFGGATAAQTLRQLSPNLQITLIEPKQSFWACPMSNLVLVGKRPMAAQQYGYQVLQKKNITVLHLHAKNIDPITNTVTLETGAKLQYDKLILSPGIALRHNAIDGYNHPEIKHQMPHAWQAGNQTRVLGKQLMDMPDGGTVVISVPSAPYRCPPGPYERASLIAHYLKHNKPKSKLLILDAKESFSKQALFHQFWQEDYSTIIEWRSASQDGRVIRVDGQRREVFTDFETIKTSVTNIIPPQSAAGIAKRAQVTDSSGWCPINGMTFESTLHTDIHIIGDAAIAAPMPKSAFSASLQAKVCAVQIIRLLSGLRPQPTTLTNTCYSFIDPKRAVSITGVYNNTSGILSQIQGAGGLSPLEASNSTRITEGQHADDWYNRVTQDAFG